MASCASGPGVISTQRPSSRSPHTDVAGHPLRAKATAATNSLISTPPLPLESNDSQVDTAAVSSAMFTPVISSLITTTPSLLQSPPHCAAAGPDASAITAAHSMPTRVPLALSFKFAISGL